MDTTVTPNPTSPDGSGVERVVPYAPPFEPAPVDPTERQLEEAAARLSGTPDGAAAEQALADARSDNADDEQPHTEGEL